MTEISMAERVANLRGQIEEQMREDLKRTEESWARRAIKPDAHEVERAYARARDAYGMQLEALAKEEAKLGIQVELDELGHWQVNFADVRSGAKCDWREP